MFGTKNEEILTYFLLIVVGYCIAKMFSRTCDGFSVGGQNISSIEYELFEPDSNNYPNSDLICGYKYDMYGEPIPGSFLDKCVHGKSCVCLDQDKNIKKSIKEDPSICRAAFGGVNGVYLGRCMSNIHLQNLKYPKYTE